MIAGYDMAAASNPTGDDSGSGGGNANPDILPDDPRPPTDGGGGGDGPVYPSWFNCQRGGILPNGETYPPAPKGVTCEEYYQLLLGYMRGDRTAIERLNRLGVIIRRR